MKKERQSSTNSAGNWAAGPQRGITKANYVERAKAFLRAAGSMPGRPGGFIIRGVEGLNGSERTRMLATEAQWIAWVEYFEAKGIPTKFLKVHGMGTVPAEWPEYFDADAPASDWGRKLPRKGVSPMARERIKIGWRNLANEISTSVFVSAQPKKKPPTAEELAAKYAAGPPLTISPELQAQLAAEREYAQSIMGAGGAG